MTKHILSIIAAMILSLTAAIAQSLFDGILPSPSPAAPAPVAQPENRLDAILYQLGIDRSRVDERHILDSIIPYDQASAMMMVPIKVDSLTNVYDAYILLTDAKSHKVKAKYIDQSKIFTSGVAKITNMRFDFANFMLNPTTRAFGIRIETGLQSELMLVKNEYMSLYIASPAGVHKVMDNLLVSSTTDQWNLQNCEGDHFNESKILVMDKKKLRKPTDFHDIIVKNRVETTKRFIKRDSLALDSARIAAASAEASQASKAEMPKVYSSNAVVKYNGGQVDSLGTMNQIVKHDGMATIDGLNVDSVAQSIEQAKEQKHQMIGEELDQMYLENLDQTQDCMEATTIEWMREYYIYRNGLYELSEE